MTNDDTTPTLLPVDIRPPWFNVIRSLQSHARRQCGAAIITIHILVEGDNPKAWTTPKVTTFEPKANADQLIEWLRVML